MTTQLVDIDRWRRWLAGRRGRAQWHRWTVDHPDLQGWSVPELLWPLTSDRTDRMQAALVALAQRGEGDAAQLLLVQLRPGLTRLARWAVTTGRWPEDESTAEVRATFFETLYRHRLDRRPRKIAANLILDTKQRLHRVPRWARPIGAGTTATGSGPGSSAGSVEADPAARLVMVTTILAAVERLPGSVASRELTTTLAYRAWVLEQPRAAIAADLGLRSGAVATRLHRLRAVVDRQDLMN